MATIDTIPVEVLTGICQFLPAHGLAALSLTSSSLRSTVQPILYRHVQISTDAADTGQFYRHGQTRAPTSFALFLDTITASPSLRSLVRSLEITDKYDAASTDEIDTLLRAFPRLSHLALHGIDILDIDELSSAITPHLKEFTSCSIGINESLLRFLDTHPEVTVWRHGVKHIMPLLDLDIPDVSLDRLSRFQTYETTSFDHPLVHGKLVSCMTNLTRLSIRYDRCLAYYNKTEPGVIPSVEDMFSHCGAHLDTLSLCGYPVDDSSDNPLPWIITKILPHTPVLRRLNVTHLLSGGIGSRPEHSYMQYDPPGVMDAHIFQDTSISFPPSLEILTWEVRVTPFPCAFMAGAVSTLR